MCQTQAAVRMCGVHLRREIEILRGIDWSVGTGESCAVLGPNGCGKTTLMNVITGRMWPTSGQVHVLGHRLGRVDVRRLRQAIGVVDPAARLQVDEKHSARDAVMTGYYATLFLYHRPSPGQIARAEQLLDIVGLSNRKDHPFGRLSTGERRRCLLARALVRVPGLLILDEPTAGLDILGRERLLATIDRLHQSHPSLSVITVTHHVEELSPRTDKVLLLKAGQSLACDHPDRALTAERLSTLYGCQVDVRNRSGRWWLEVAPEAWAQLLDENAP